MSQSTRHSTRALAAAVRRSTRTSPSDEPDPTNQPARGKKPARSSASSPDSSPSEPSEHDSDVHDDDPDYKRQKRRDAQTRRSSSSSTLGGSASRVQDAVRHPFHMSVASMKSVLRKAIEHVRTLNKSQITEAEAATLLDRWDEWDTDDWSTLANTPEALFPDVPLFSNPDASRRSERTLEANISRVAARFQSEYRAHEMGKINHLLVYAPRPLPDTSRLPRLAEALPLFASPYDVEPLALPVHQVDSKQIDVSHTMTCIRFEDATAHTAAPRWTVCSQTNWNPRYLVLEPKRINISRQFCALLFQTELKTRWETKRETGITDQQVVMQAARIAHVACSRFHSHAPCSFWCSLDPTTAHTAASLQRSVSKSKLEGAGRKLMALYGEGRRRNPSPPPTQRRPRPLAPSPSSSSSSNQAPYPRPTHVNPLTTIVAGEQQPSSSKGDVRLTTTIEGTFDHGGGASRRQVVNTKFVDLTNDDDDDE